MAKKKQLVTIVIFSTGFKHHDRKISIVITLNMYLLTDWLNGDSQDSFGQSTSF
jgi:hypothetical protein